MDIFYDLDSISLLMALRRREGHKDTSCPLKRYESALQIIPGCNGNFGAFGNC